MASGSASNPMRRRLLAALVGVAVATLLLYAGPRAFLIADMVRDREQLGLDRTADLIVDAVDVRDATGLPTTEADVRALIRGREDVGVTIVRPDGTRIAAGEVGDAASVAVRRLDGGGEVRVSLSADAVDDRVADALVPVLIFGAASIGFAVLVALVLARRLARPFAGLAAHADRLDLDDESPAPRAGVPEADQIADALDRSQRRLAELLRSEREFSSNASHQLRTPLAALRLRIEDLSTWPQVDDEVRTELDAALVEVDRLADTVTDLLELARSGGIGGWRELDLEGTVAAAVARWEGRFADAGRRIVAARSGGAVRVTGSERAVHHVLDVLFENALTHGAGVVDVAVQEVDGNGVVRVADQGSFDRAMTTAAFTRRARGSASTGSGIGLDLARSVAESAGARLRLVSHTPTVFELVLPPHRDAA